MESEKIEYSRSCIGIKSGDIVEGPFWPEPITVSSCIKLLGRPETMEMVGEGLNTGGGISFLPQ